MVKIQELLEPNERLIKESSSGPFSQVTYMKSLVSNTQGRLYLTSDRILFLPGNFQNTDATILVVGRLFKSPDSVHIPLSSITGVEKGWGEKITIHADKKYDFMGMSGAGEWVTAIERARSTPHTAYAPPVSQPTPRPAGSKFCSNCGKPLKPQDKFCPECGTAQQAQPSVCPRCSNEVAPDQKFCNNCGTPLR